MATPTIEFLNLINSYSREEIDNAFSNTFGRPYGNWIGSRYTARVEGTPILEPIYTIESLIRDEVNTIKTDHIIGDTTPKTYHLYNLEETDANFFTDSRITIYTNDITVSSLVLTSSYSGGVTTITTADSVTSLITPNGTIIFSDIRNKFPQINTTSFDAIQGEFISSGYNLYLDSPQTIASIISNILKENHLMLYLDYDEYKLYSLVAGTTVGTFDSPLISNGLPQVRTALSDLDDVYSSFTIPYAYDYGLGNTKKKHTVSYTGDSSGSLADAVDLCEEARLYYKTNNVFTFDNTSMYASTSVIEVMKRLIPFYTKRRMLVSYMGDIFTHKDYNIGQQVLIDIDSILPTGVNNTAKFVIYGRKIVTRNTNQYFEFQLMEVLDAIT